MARKRTGASSFLLAVRAACRFSHFPQFWQGMAQVIGADAVTIWKPLWEAFCAAVEAYMDSDDHPFQIDYTGGEEQDITEA